MNSRCFIILTSLLFLCLNVRAQRIITEKQDELGQHGAKGKRMLGGASTKKGDKENKGDELKIGIRTWTIDEFGKMDSVATDTCSYQFQNDNFTEGRTGHYNTLGNMGSPRMSRIFTDRPERFAFFIFSQPYDFFLQPVNKFHFTNTLSPITNITYHETTSSENGEDRICAKYAVNIDKTAGIGFKLDYLYGRGYYDNQATSQFGATLYGSVIKEKYKAHVLLNFNYLKTAENGGITDDDYISNPEKFPSSFGTKDIPTRLNKAWNKMYVNTGRITHSYSLGFYRHPKQSQQAAEDSIRQILMNKGKSTDSTAAKLSQNIPPITPTVSDSIQKPVLPKGAIPLTPTSTDSTEDIKMIFIPVTHFIHTLEVNSNQKNFISNTASNNNFFTNNYFEGDLALDKNSHFQLSNMLAVELCEGFNKWALAGLRLFVQHDFNHYSIPATASTFSKFNENRFSVGGMILHHKSPSLQYEILGKTTSTAGKWGEFELSAHGNSQLRLLKDTLSIKIDGSIINQQPTFFYRHFQSKYLWWENNGLDKQFSTRIRASIRSIKAKAKMEVTLENIKKYTYFSAISTPSLSTDNTASTMSAEVVQEPDNIQLISASLSKNFKLGILNWENEIIYQKSTNQEALPLPDFTAYSNLYLLFKIAKVLNVQFGGDVRYFTAYDAPTYHPVLGMYVNQDKNDQLKIGNYPIVNIYANFHLKHTRFYIMYSHLNYSKEGGKSFLAPHYPINPGIIKLGLSWNFFN